MCLLNRSHVVQYVDNLAYGCIGQGFREKTGAASPYAMTLHAIANKMTCRWH